MRRIQQVWRGRSGRPALAALVTLAALLGGWFTPASALADNTSPAPGLPPFVMGNVRQYFDPPVTRHPTIQRNQLGAMHSSFASGQTDAGRAKLAIRLPTSLVAINLVSNTVYGPLYKPNGKFDRTLTEASNFVALLYLQSPHGSSPAWGSLPPVKVTSLAFGVIPVSATLSLAQTRTAPTSAQPDGLPIPLSANVYEKVDIKGDQSHHIYDAAAQGDLVVHLSDIRVDGQAIAVGGTCTTRSPARLALVGKASTAFPVPPGSFNPTVGGDLYGRVTIPAFSGCRTPDGEDLSPLLTNVLSGDETSVHLYQGSLGQNQLGCVVKEAGPDGLPCMQATPLPVPTRAGQVSSHPDDWTPDPPPAPLPFLPSVSAP